MLKALEAGTDPYLGLLDFHNTPTDGLGTSPAQRLFSRRTKTLLPTAGNLLNQADADAGKTAQLLQARKDRQSFYYNNGSKTLQPLEKGDVVRIQPTGTKKGQRWTPSNSRGASRCAFVPSNYRGQKGILDESSTSPPFSRDSKSTPF